MSAGTNPFVKNCLRPTQLVSTVSRLFCFAWKEAFGSVVDNNKFVQTQLLLFLTLPALFAGLVLAG